jgi:c-di-GMP-binding flagellar brake protein YcgR
METTETTSIVREILYPGKSVQVEVINNYGNKIIRKTTVCALEDSSLILNLPYKGDIFSHVSSNADIAIVCKHNEEPEDHVFFTRFITILGINPPVAILNPPAEYKKGRQYVRFQVSVPFSYFINHHEYKGGVVNNLSLTGLLATIQPNHQLHEHDKLAFHLFIPGKTGPLLLAGNIVRITKQDTQYQIALHFPHILLQHQNQIMKFLFSSQKTLMKNDPPPYKKAARF